MRLLPGHDLEGLPLVWRGMVADLESRLCCGAFDSHLGGVLPLKKIEDFSVPECVAHYYEALPNAWFWHCLTCDSGSNKNKRHPNGHKHEKDAKEGMKYHSNAKRMERQQKLYRAWWWLEVMTTTDLEYFIALWRAGNHPEIKDDPSDLMAVVQSDNRLWEYMVKLNGQTGNGTPPRVHGRDSARTASVAADRTPE